MVEELDFLKTYSEPLNSMWSYGHSTKVARVTLTK